MIYQLSLQDGVPASAQGQVFYLPPPTEPYTLRLLVPATSLVAHQGTVHTNHPPKGTKFERSKFYDFKLSDSSLHKDSFVDIEIHQSGPFSVYTSYVKTNGHYGQTEQESTKTEEWNFIVSPELKLSPNSLCVQTVLAKLMGKLGEWDSKLDKIAAKGYNMIHFVPLQERGESDSPFSLYDQLSWDATTFPNGEKDIELLVQKLDKRGILALSDVVLNHTANNSPWLKDHPEVGYTAETSPHLQAAIELDRGLLKLSEEAKDTKIENWSDVEAIVARVDKEIIEASKLWEYYVLDVPALEKCVEQNPFEGRITGDLPKELGALASRLVDTAAENFSTLGDRFSRHIETSALAEYVAGSEFSAKQILDEVNSRLYAEYNADRSTILDQLKGRLKYLRLDEHGPRWGAKITKKAPIAEPYFTYVKNKAGEEIAMANNGWVWAADPLNDFAGPESKAYLTRQVIIWGDCVKLRYGSGPESCPYLWDRMTKYTQLLAKHFTGLRIDNCHSTPWHVGAYLLDRAREVRPNLYVVAELFSGSQDIDKLYVEKLGITSLLREAIQPNSVKELSTQVNVNGGLPIGSFIVGEVLEDSAVKVRSQPIHSWLMECTHDNETFAEKRTVEDTLSSAGLVAMCQVASGCTMGNDECYPKALNIVTEERPYVFDGGITEAKTILNKLHTKMGEMNAFESFTDHQGQYITVNRINPETGDGYFLIARTAFYKDGDQQLPEVFLENTKAEWYNGWSMSSDDARENPEDKIVPIKVDIHNLEPFNKDFDGKSTKIFPPAAHDFPQGSVAIFKLSRVYDAKKIERLVRSGQKDAVKDLDLLSLSILLYRTNGEERTSTEGRFGVYDIPDHGALIYAGLQGWETPLRSIIASNNLGAAICNNLRQGEWAFHSLVERLEYYEEAHRSGFGPTIAWLKDRIEICSSLPSFLRPRYFAAIVIGLYEAAVERAVSLMPENIGATEFMTRLALTSLQMVSNLPGASLVARKQEPSMAAGLPHFSEGIMRCWGRDVFLSVGGLLHETGRLHEAKQHIVGFGTTLKHGLIPNLLDSGRNPRYNARDAVWFFVQSIQDHCNFTKSYDILNEQVPRRFPLDDKFVEWDSPEAFAYTTSVGDIIMEILARHAKGIEFREHDAGPKIDMHMKDNGFNQKIWVDWENGLVFGGNQDNCGTWMDKNGESVRGNNDGVPGTPRDGAAVEIIGLLKSCLRWVVELESSGKYKFSKTSVENQHGDQVSFKDWNDLLQQNFEKHFYIPVNADQDEKYDLDVSLVNRRGVYKDLYRSGKPYEDYQLRPNFTIAIVVAPELFNLEHATSALGLADEFLCGPVGMATLDPSDWNYHPYYENGIDNDDFATAKGRNYHQGPEWVWCKGVFLQAVAVVDKLRKVPKDDTISLIRTRLQGDVQWLNTSPWAGLTELTQKDGAFCGDSSPTQAWSTGRMIEAITETL